MEYEKAVRIYNTLTQTSMKNEPDYAELYDDFKRYAVEYARIRVNWYMADREK
jgi:hypothetical protein